MKVTAAILRATGVTLRSEFMNGVAAITPAWDKIATLVPSTVSRETYAWLDDIPKMREWIGDRHRKTLGERVYQLVNRDYESSIIINRNKFEDNELGTFSTIANALGRSAADNPDTLVFDTLVQGFERECFDGQNFFDTEHPVGPAGKEALVSNMQAGAGEPWFLLDTTQSVKPLIYQLRKAADLTQMTETTDENVYRRNEFEWGTHSREIAGYSFWQLAYGSKAELTADNYEAARTAMSSLTDDEGEPLGITPNLLVYGPANERKALRLINNERTANGETNEYQGSAELLMSARIRKV